MAEPPSEDRIDILNVAWLDVVRFIRQLSHDLRNHLNAIQLQSAYIAELEREQELKGEIKRLQEMISGMTSTLQLLSKTVSEVRPSLISYQAADFMEDLRTKIDHDFSGESTNITWDIQLGEAALNIDPQLLQEAFTELLANAFRHNRGEGALVATAKMDKNRFLFALQEPKNRFDSPTGGWGHEPLRKISQGHYSLGLNRVRAIVEAHGGGMYAQYNPKVSALTTTLVLPVSGDSSKDTRSGAPFPAF
jgi:K+-sensing histidine kinase KdpD